MSSTVKTFAVGYNPLNNSNIFTNGDHITGRVTLELAKDCKMDSLCIKLKGKAEVQWSERKGEKTKRYFAKEKYFSIKQVIIEECKGNIIEQGCHVYPFTFQIPAGELPSSFKDSYGKIIYTLEAVLSRSMRIDSKARAEFTLINTVNLHNDRTLPSPQQGNTEKKLKVFSKGTVGMDVNIERTGFHQGGGIKVVASINNKSSRDITPKYCLYMKCCYFAKGKRRVETRNVLKEVGEPIPHSAGQTVTRIITIPPDMCVSILNCNILTVEYRLKVYLDVKYALDPEVKFPVVILPALRGDDGEILPVDPTYGSEAFPGFDVPGETCFPQDPAAAYPPPPSYGAYGMYPPVNDFSQKS